MGSALCFQTLITESRNINDVSFAPETVPFKCKRAVTHNFGPQSPAVSPPSPVRRGRAQLPRPKARNRRPGPGERCPGWSRGVTSSGGWGGPQDLKTLRSHICIPVSQSSQSRISAQAVIAIRSGSTRRKEVALWGILDARYGSWQM